MPDAVKLLKDQSVVVANVQDAPSDVIQAFDRAPVLFVDTETTALHPWRGGEIALFQIHEPASKKTFLGRVEAHQEPPEWLVDLFRKGRTFVGHNLAGFDLHFMHCWGLPWKRARIYDTLVAESLISTSGRRDVSKSLRSSVKRRTGYEVDKTIEHGNWRADQMSDRQVEYAAIDVLSLPQLYDEQLAKANETNQASALDMEMDVLPVFAQMSINGLPMNMDNLDNYMQQSKEGYEAAEQLLRTRLGQINLNSHPQLKKALWATGIELDSTAADTLVDTILFDPESDNAKLLQALLTWRSAHKRTEMYGSKEWQAAYIQPDGRIHARFWQVGADTTRVSSSDPNLQQVPKDGRWIFGGVPGYKMVSVDYSQIEVRIAAEISNDQVLMEMLGHDDVHSAIASAVFKVPISGVSKAQRKLAKAMVFCLLFGAGWKRLYEYARRSGSTMTEEEAQDMFSKFFETFQGLYSIRQKAYALAKHRSHLLITLPNGARRVLAGQKMSPTVILNTPVQGTAAVGMKRGLILAGKRGLDEYLGAVVHDETVACVPERDAEEYAHCMQDCLVEGMREYVKNCPVKAEIARSKDGSLPDVWLA